MVLDSGEQRAFPGRFGRRRLVFALSLSLLAHLLLLRGNMVQPPQPAAVPGLTASLPPRAMPPSLAVPPLHPMRPVRPALPVNPAHPSRRQAVAARDTPRPAPRAVLSAPTFSSAPLAPSVSPSASPSSAPPSAAVTPPRAAADAAVVPSAAGVAAPAAPSAPAPAGSPNAIADADSAVAIAVSADGLRRYRLGLAVQARRFKRYPPRALAAGWSGTTIIRLAVDAAGRSEASVARSSGHALLDDAARTLIAQSAERTPLPEELRGQAFVIDLPVLFDIADERAAATRAEPAE